MEYEYAMKKGIPIISFLHKNSENIPVGKSESEKELRKKLEGFKELVQQKMCKYYESPLELGSIVSRSLVRLIKDKPQPGWVKSTFIPTEDSTKEILELTKQIEHLKAELEKSKTKAPVGTEQLSQGDDKILIDYTFTAQGDWSIGSKYYGSSLELTWNEIFAQTSPLLIDESAEAAMRSKTNELIREKECKELAKKYKKDDGVPTDFKIADKDFQTLKIQFRALNLMTESIRKRGVHNRDTYWTLTPYGDTIMIRLRAIKR